MRHTKILLVTLLCLAATGCDRHQMREELRQHAGRHEGGREGRHGGEAGGAMRAGGHGIRRVCAADLEKFCASDQTGRDRRQCLDAHKDQLAADCKTALAEREQRHGGRRGGATGDGGASGDE
jgi:hypothetical protein